MDSTKREELKKMMGLNSTSGTPVYKLNKITMSGDDSTFKLTDLTTEREKGTKPTIEDLGKTVDGVILKMRWQLSRYDEPNMTVYSSTEYDDKWKDEVTIYPSKDKGSVVNIKERHKLATQRIVYFYVPKKQMIVRLVVKASALSGEKNENGELGLFQHIDEFMKTESLPCEFVTTCTGVFRQGKNQDGSPNKRKDHYAMTFATGRKLTDSEFEKVEGMINEVNLKTNSPSQEEPPQEESQDYQKDDINPDDIPF